MASQADAKVLLRTLRSESGGRRCGRLVALLTRCGIVEAK